MRLSPAECVSVVTKGQSRAVRIVPRAKGDRRGRAYVRRDLCLPRPPVVARWRERPQRYPPPVRRTGSPGLGEERLRTDLERSPNPMLYPVWLNPGDNSWQLTAATLVGLMSVPGLVVLYGGVMQKRWSVNSMMLSFVAFALDPRDVGSLRLQDGLRSSDAHLRPEGRQLLRQLPRQARPRARITSRSRGRRTIPNLGAAGSSTSPCRRSSTSSSCSRPSRRS